MRLLIMGPPGAGKGTQAVALARRVQGPHISTGDIFRTHVQQQTGLGTTARRYIDAGEYVPDDVTNAMIKERLAQGDAGDAFVLDGYPRTVDQLHTLDVDGVGQVDEVAGRIHGAVQSAAGVKANLLGGTSAVRSESPSGG
ncbi:nucleoside monophosphate kinase [Streptomyces shenzhenensis]|uniref:nucleoside monophosphate kinase n=1 Tax=Streptomyces shenzhenensis TaxID=943815 RepID=UPI0033F82F6C